ncbi:MAG: SPOR domain-containing protein, partial [Halarsenatibacteraceae bacterium]
VIDDSNESDETEETGSDRDETNVGFYVQVGAFGNGDNANNLLEDLENRGFQVRIEGSEPYRVQVVGGDTRDAAEERASELQGLGFETLIISQ